MVISNELSWVGAPLCGFADRPDKSQRLRWKGKLCAGIDVQSFRLVKANLN